MIKLSIIKNNSIVISNAISHELNCLIDKHFRKRVKNCQFSLKFKNYCAISQIESMIKLRGSSAELQNRLSSLMRLPSWDGYNHIYNSTRKSISLGHLRGLYTFLKQYDNDIKIVSDDFSKPLFRERIQIANLSNITLHDWQTDLVKTILTKKRCIIESPTGTGKTVVLASVVHSLVKHGQKILILFNRIELAKQTKKRFVEYGMSKDDIEVVTSRNKETRDAKIVLITVRSSHRIKCRDFTAVIADESHHAQSSTYMSVFRKCINAWFRLGVSATYQDDKTVDSAKIIGAIGPMVYRGDIEEHFDNGELSIPEICFIDYAPMVKPSVEFDHYANLELSHIVQNSERNKTIVKIAQLFLKRNKRVCILCHRQDHGKILGKSLGVEYFYGESSEKDIERGLGEFEHNVTPLFLGSVGVFGEGTDIKGGFDVLIIVNSFASNMPVIQSIGRGLRKNKGMEVIIVDFVDRCHKTFLAHSKNRIKICKDKYTKERVKIMSVEDLNKRKAQ